MFPGSEDMQQGLPELSQGCSWDSSKYSPLDYRQEGIQDMSSGHLCGDVAIRIPVKGLHGVPGLVLRQEQQHIIQLHMRAACETQPYLLTDRSHLALHFRDSQRKTYKGFGNSPVEAGFAVPEEVECQLLCFCLARHLRSMAAGLENYNGQEVILPCQCALA